ncbi:sigma-70 family RNA polymerase sigma factor [Roseibacillus ishigakijimensis]|uniref:Sigma-70 family RNA polymerase sigma factor n=2 Tax=Roseibacillus ishigakijimensis TaxID=454146 RepID=A0A934VKN1_9BACT|nr:sigma-70 family RNA polymerase sigma factor [Roseibacillus ishigakijimensis]
MMALIAQQQSILRALIRSMIPGSSECEDVLQETNLVLWRKRATFTPGTNFNAWAGTIARFQVMAWRQRSLKNQSLAFDEEVLERLSQAASTQWENFQGRQEALQHCLAQLAADQRELVEHRYFERASLAEFARRKGRTHAAVRKILERVRASLRDCINRQLQGEVSA